MNHHNIDIPREKIAEFCRKNHIRRLALFGSILGDEFHPDSDIDLLVEFEPGQTPSLFKMAGLEIELTKLIGKKVDLRTPAELSRYFREEVINGSEVQYEER